MEVILSLIRSIMELEEGLEIVALPIRSPDKISSFLEFMREKGVDTSKVEIKATPIKSGDDDVDCGLFATNDLNENDLILSIPLSVMMTAETPGIAGVSCSDIGFRE